MELATEALVDVWRSVDEAASKEGLDVLRCRPRYGTARRRCVWRRCWMRSSMSYGCRMSPGGPQRCPPLRRGLRYGGGLRRGRRSRRRVPPQRQVLVVVQDCWWATDPAARGLGWTPGPARL